MRAAYARALGLAEPDITWHVARDGLVELVQTLAVICGALGKIGYDVMILMATEIGEVFEPFSSHRGASSTMPQKRNPISSEVLLANAKMSRDAASLMLDSMVQDLERATGPWHGEWLALPQVCLLTAGSLAQAQFMLSGLIVDQDAMKRNLHSTRGLIVAEAVMMGLAPALGRQHAHDEVYAACRDAVHAWRGASRCIAAAAGDRIRPAPRSARRPVRAGQLSRNGRGDGGPRAGPSNQALNIFAGRRAVTSGLSASDESRGTVTGTGRHPFRSAPWRARQGPVTDR